MHSDDRGPVRARVCCAPFTLLRLLTLHCTRRRGAAEGEGAQQTEKGVADDPARSSRGASITQAGLSACWSRPASGSARGGPESGGALRIAGRAVVLAAGSVRVLAPAPVRSFALISRAGVGKSNPAAPGASPGREIVG